MRVKFWNTPENRPAFEYARLATANFSKSFYISSLLLPMERRWATFGLYGFCRYFDNLVDNPRNRFRDELMRELDFMAYEIGLAYRTQKSEHPVIRAFIVAAEKFGIPFEYPLELIAGVRMDLENQRFQTFDDLYLFCYRVAGVVGLMMTHILGYREPIAFQYAEKLGVAMQLTNILRDIREDKNIGRIYLPLNEIRKFGVTETDILQENYHEAFQRLIKFQVQRAHQYYIEAERGIPFLERESQFAIYSASKIYRDILHKIEAHDYNPFLGRVFVPQVKKFGILIYEYLRTRWRFRPQSSLSYQMSFIKRT
jgi:phytoene synthase